MADKSLIDPKDLLARTPGDGGGGGAANPKCIAIAAGDTPHDFKPGRTANNTSTKADDEPVEAGEQISADQEELVLAVAGLAVYFAKQGIDNVDTNPPPALPDWEKDSDVPGMEYLQGAISTLTKSTVSGVSNYERNMEKYILKDDAVTSAFGAVTTVYIQDVLSSWEKWSTLPADDKKPERPQFWCDICGKSTDAVSKALINKTIDLKWNPNDDTYDPNKVYKKGKRADEKYLRILANFMLTYMHPEDNAGSMKAVFVFDMSSGSVGKTLTVLPQVKNALIPQVVSDSACTNMKQLDKGRNMLWFPATNAAGDEYTYQANIFTYPLGIRFVMNVSSAGGPVDYNNKDDSVADNFKITIKRDDSAVIAGSLKDITKRIFGANGDDQVVLDFRQDASNVGPSVAYLASLIYAIRNNMDTNMGAIPGDLSDTNPTSSNMINISDQFAQLATNINTSGLNVTQKKQAFAILCFMLFDIKRSGDWEQARACFYIPEDVVGKPMFCTGDILCGVFARLIGANSIWRSPKGNVKDWNFRIHRKVNKALDPDVISAIQSVQKCTEIIKILGFTAGLDDLQRELQATMVAAAQAANEGFFILPKDSEHGLRIRTEQIITYLARIRALDIHSHAKTILDTIGGVTNLYAQSFPKVNQEDGTITRLNEAEIEEIFIEPLKILINLFYATGNPQPGNAASFQKKIAIQTYKALYDEDIAIAGDAITKFKSGPGGDRRIEMKVENPFLDVVITADGEQVPKVTEISTDECMSKVEKLVQYEETMQALFEARGDDAQAAQFGSIAKALSRLASNAKDPSIPFSELRDTVSNYGIRVKSVEKIKNRADGTPYYTTATEYDLGSKGGQLLRQGNLFNAGFQSASFGYAASDLQRLGSAIIQQFSGLTSAGGIRFKTSADNYVGTDGFTGLTQYQSIMGNRIAVLDQITTLKKQISQAQARGDAAAAAQATTALQDAERRRIQIAAPANTDEKDHLGRPLPAANFLSTQRLFCNSSNPGSWLSMTEEKGKRGSKYMLAVKDSLTFKNDSTTSMIGTGMGYLSGFMRNSIAGLDKAKAKFLAAPVGDGFDAFRAQLFDGERRVQIALSEQNAVSTAGFRLFNMGKPEWNNLLRKSTKAKDTPEESVKLVLESKASLAIWFYGLFELQGERSIIQQYLVRQPDPANIDIMNAISRLAGPPAAGADPKLPWQNLATTPQDDVDNPFAIGWNWLGYIKDDMGATAPVVDYTQFTDLSRDLSGYQDLITDVVMVLDECKGCLPMTYLVMALYARQMDRIFPTGAKGALIKDDLTCGFIVSEAVKQCGLSTGTTKEDLTIDDIIFAAMQLVMYGLNANVPRAADFPRVGGGHNDILQFGGSNYARIGDPLATSTQNELIQDLYLRVIGIAQGAVSSLFSTKVTLAPAVTAAIAAQAPPGTPEVTEVTIANLIEIIRQDLLVQAPSPPNPMVNKIDVFEMLMIALTQESRDPPLPSRFRPYLNDPFGMPTTLNKIAQAMYAYGDEIQRIWSNGMQDVTDNASFEYTPTYTDLVLSTAFAYSGNVSGNTAPDSTYLYGIYYNGPLLNIPDAGNYLGPNTALVNPNNPALPGCNVMTGLPSLFSLFVYANGRTDIPEIFDIGLFDAASNDAFYRQLFVDFNNWAAQNQSTWKLATSNGNPARIDPNAVFRPSIVLYQLIKICSLSISDGSSRGPPPIKVYPDVARRQRYTPEEQTKQLLKLLNDFSDYFMEDGGQGQGIISSMASIPQAAAVAPTPPDNFIAPVLKNIQALSLIGTLITPPRDTQIAEATGNVNEILQSNQLTGTRSVMVAAVTQAVQDYQSAAAANDAAAAAAAAAVINNLVDMINQMNGYSLINPANNNEYFPEGDVNPAHLVSQMALKPIPPLEYPGTARFQMQVPPVPDQVLDTVAWLQYAQSVVAGNDNAVPYQTLFVTNQINQDYDARGLSKGFTESILANMAFDVATANSQTLATLANNTYFNTPWVTTNPNFNQDRMLILYRYVLNNYPNTGQRGDQIRDLLQNQGLRGVLFGGGSKNRTRKHRKKHNKTRREKKNIGNKTRGRDKHKKKRHTRKSD